MADMLFIILIEIIRHNESPITEAVTGDCFFISSDVITVHNASIDIFSNCYSFYISNNFCIVVNSSNMYGSIQ